MKTCSGGVWGRVVWGVPACPEVGSLHGFGGVLGRCVDRCPRDVGSLRLLMVLIHSDMEEISRSEGR